MNNEEIKALLRDLSEKAEYEGKSETVHISFEPKDAPEKEQAETGTKEDFREEELFEKPQEGTERSRRGRFSLSSFLDTMKPSEKEEDGKPRKKKRFGKKKEEEQAEPLKEETTPPEEEDDFVDPDAFRLPQMKEYTPTTRRRTPTVEDGNSESLQASGADDTAGNGQASGADDTVKNSQTSSGDITSGENQASPAEGSLDESPETPKTSGLEEERTASGKEEAGEAGDADSREKPAEKSADGPETAKEESSFAAGAEMKALNNPEDSLSEESADGSEEGFEKPASRKRRGFSLKLPVGSKKKEKKKQEEPAGNDDLLIREEPVDFSDDENNIRRNEKKDLSRDEASGDGGSMWEKPDFDSDDADFREDTSKKDVSKKKANGPGIKETLAKAGDFLRQKGVSAREIAMIAAGLVLLVLIAILLIRALGQKPVSGNVTADEGLRVSVDKEPENWTRSGEVTLSIKTKEPINDITVNGQSVEFTGSNKTQITVEADTDVLEIGVTSDMLRNATVETAFIDGDAPDLEVTVSGNTATLTVSDERSGIAGVYYGTITPLSNVPLYQEYTGPFEIEPGTWYSYYAIDAAGNMTEPVVTDMSEAAELVLSASDVALFPGETKKITAFARPSGAFLNGLTISNNNEEVISLSDDGTIRALEEGTATITASAKGLGTATCQVTVRQDAEIKITALGDITLGYDDNFAPAGRLSTVADQNGYSYFFENVRSILSEDDLTFANLEGPLSDQGTREYKTFAFHGSPDYTEILKDGSIEAVTLANNHAGDYGEAALEDTKNNLTQAGITYCDEEDIAITEVSGIRVALIGIYAVDQEDKSALVRTSLAKARSAEADLIIVAFHWGTELVAEPDSVQRELGHLAIDEGADLVVGHHPHLIQGIEQYNGKYIVYSLGNFCFGGNTNPAEYDTIIYQETFHVGMSGQAESTGVNIIPCHISSSTATNNYQPTPASGDDANNIMQKLNQLCEEFGTSF